MTDAADRRATGPTTATPDAAAGGTADDGSAALAAVLAAVSGYVNAVGIMYVAGVFVSFMSGNTTNAAVALGKADWPSFVHVAVVIPLYVAGVVAGALLMRIGRHGRLVVLLAIDVLLAGFLLVRLLTQPEPPTDSGPLEIVTLALLAVPMAMLNTTLRRVGSSSVGLGYVTGTLVSFGEHLADALRTGSGASGRAAALYGALWAAFFLGGALGAFAVSRIAVWAIVLPILVVAVVLAGPGRRPGAQPS